MILIDSDFIYSKEYRDRMIRKSLLEEGREEGREDLITKNAQKR